MCTHTVIAHLPLSHANAHVKGGVGGWGCKHQFACPLPLSLCAPRPLRVPVGGPLLCRVVRARATHPAAPACWGAHKGMPPLPLISAPTHMHRTAQDPTPSPPFTPNRVGNAQPNPAPLFHPPPPSCAREQGPPFTQPWACPCPCPCPCPSPSQMGSHGCGASHTRPLQCGSLTPEHPLLPLPRFACATCVGCNQEGGVRGGHRL
jgi:hypothetical protein